MEVEKKPSQRADTSGQPEFARPVTIEEYRDAFAKLKIAFDDLITNNIEALKDSKELTERIKETSDEIITYQLAIDNEVDPVSLQLLNENYVIFVTRLAMFRKELEGPKNKVA